MARSDMLCDAHGRWSRGPAPLTSTGRWLRLVAAVALAATSGAASAADLGVVAPRPWQVVQRTDVKPGPDGDRGRGELSIVLAADGIDAAGIEARVVSQSDATVIVDWRPPAGLSRDADGRVRGRLMVPAGGWYRLEIRGRRANDGGAETAAVEPIGVGEVFLVAGQSYATNWNDERLTVADPRRRVAALDLATGTWRVADDPQPVPDRSDGGSIWPPAGDAIVAASGVPVGFVNVAWGATAAAEWLPGKPLHDRLVAAGSTLGRFRAVLWQQGESDVIAGTSTADYVAALEQMRNAAVARWGFEPPWLCGFSTHHPTVYDDPPGEARIRAAVELLASRPGFRAGPDTDTLRGEARGGPGSRRHFSPLGQRRAAALWSDVLLDLLRTQDAAPDAGPAGPPQGATRPGPDSPPRPPRG